MATGLRDPRGHLRLQGDGVGGEAPPGHHLRLAGPALFWIPRDRPLTGTSDVHGCPQPSLSWTARAAGRQINCRDPELS